MQGPTANRFAHVIVGEVRVLCCPLGFTLLSVGASPAFALAGGAWASLFSLSGPCSRGCRAAWADAPSGGVRVSPVYLRSGRCRCCCARLGNMLPVGVWLLGVVALIAYAVSGCPVTVPGWCSCGVSLCLRVVLFAGGCARVLVCARLVCARAVVRLVSGGVFCYARRGVPARLFVCRLQLVVARVAGLLRFILVVGYCVGVRFVSTPAHTVTWFMSVCVGVRLTATLVVVYCLLCKGRFWQFTARFCALGCSR